jgi:hypothetical protein
MKIFIFASILALLCPKPTHARLGESIDQCNLRYGDPIKKDSSRGFWLYTYDKFDLEIVVSFLDNKCFFITYTKKETDDNFSPRPLPFSDAEISTLLKANSSNETWRLRRDDGGPSKTWVRGDHGSLYFAESGSFNRTFTAFSNESLQRAKKITANKEMKDLDGL